MTTEMIEKFIDSKNRKDNKVKIYFKERPVVTGLFIRMEDYKELKSKNFWRIVNHIHIDEWKKTKNMELARIFNGIAFTKLTDEQ